jgi:general secretion pathway protein A
MLLSALNDTEFIPVVILAHPGMSKMGLLGCVLEEMGIPCFPGRENVQMLLDRIHAFLMESYSNRRRPVIIVDEAHFLPSDQLHMIRALTNLETPHEKLCTVILFAEETFPRRLRHKRYASLRSRISTSAYLMPMSRAETEQYVKFRLMVAGAMQDIFDGECFDLIHSHAEGICREVNKIADNSLMEAFLQGEPTVGRRIVEHCIHDSI